MQKLEQEVMGALSDVKDEVEDSTLQKIQRAMRTKDSGEEEEMVGLITQLEEATAAPVIEDDDGSESEE